jgi:hypothetical protein
MILLLAACTVIEGNGVMATESRDVEGVTSLSATLSVDVRVTPAEVASAELTCDENLLEHIRTDLVDGELTLRTEPDVFLNPSEGCLLDLAAPCLRSIASSGSGGVFSDQPLCNTESLHSSGSGGISLAGVSGPELSMHGSGSGAVDAGELDVGSLDVHFSGSGGGSASGACVDADIHLSGSGPFLAQGLSCETADITVSGSGGVELTVTGSANVNTSGSGGVDLWGGAVVSSDSSGSGDVTVH